MKGILRIFKKKAYFSSLHMKRKSRLSKNEKYFNFFKMDKKNVQNFLAQIFYGKIVNCDDKKFLASHYKKNNSQIVTINFYKKRG